ncbi:hypothetical protein NLG97_g3749 [Lecanicillium saksenae]|uniref:Uncharacterized protein n=1 Tax=Lecanicillium saksenae TaxID=468837 RepID=A0ACC1QYM0_9HYPO|nr:hypothetical protein NLG97_g3749 [Lecanicillium saksenae]
MKLFAGVFLFAFTGICLSQIDILGVFGASPDRQLQKLKSSVDSIDKGLDRWTGSPLYLPVLALQAAKLQKDITDTGASFKRAGPRTADADQALLVDAQSALDSLGHAMATVGGAATKFDKIPMGVPVIFGVLKAFEISTNRAIKLGVDGASPDAKPRFEAMQQTAKAYFKNAIDLFEQQLDTE